MNTKEYQEQAARTLIEDSKVMPLTAREHRIVWNAVGLAGEAAEIDEETGGGFLSTELMCEACEMLEIIKKGVFHAHGLNAHDLRPHIHNVLIRARRLAEGYPDLTHPVDKELGDMLWYTAALCSCLEIDMSELLPDAGALAPIMDANIAKLKLRFPDGWSVEDSKTRRDLEIPA